MINVLSAELLKLRKRPAIWILVGVWLALNLTVPYLFPYLSYRTGTPTGPDGAAPPHNCWRRCSRRIAVPGSRLRDHSWLA